MTWNIDFLKKLTLILLDQEYPSFANSVDPDQLAWSALFAIKNVNL